MSAGIDDKAVALPGKSIDAQRSGHIRRIEAEGDGGIMKVPVPPRLGRNRKNGNTGSVGGGTVHYDIPLLLHQQPHIFFAQVQVPPPPPRGDIIAVFRQEIEGAEVPVLPLLLNKGSKSIGIFLR